MQCYAEGHEGVLVIVRKGEAQRVRFSIEDLERVSQYSWYINSRGNPERPRLYVYAPYGKPRKLIYLHHLILPLRDGLHVDHINGDPFDCRRENLRLVTRGEQSENTRDRVGYRNVNAYMTKDGEKYRVTCHKGGTNFVAGTYTDLQEALDAAKKLRAEVFTHHNEERLLYRRREEFTR